MLRPLPLLLVAMCCGSLRAHTVPLIEVVAEFSGSRGAVVTVNLDPRLFLSDQPTQLPPVPASWWFEQDEAAQAATRKQAADYVNRTFSFTVGATPLETAWKVQPIDSASAFPLGQASTETHLLAEYHGTLPASPGDFKVAISKECAVPVILLCSTEGNPERTPQSLFPGENSRGFPLPALPQSASADTTSTSANPQPAGWLAQATRLMQPKSAFGRLPHTAVDHLALAALLGFALSRGLARAVGLLAAFHAVDMLAAYAVVAGWLPSAPGWMAVAYWLMLALTATHLLILKSREGGVLVALAVAAMCHGLNTPHLHLEYGAAGPVAWMFMQSGVLIVKELGVLLLCAALARLVLRRKEDRSCATPA